MSFLAWVWIALIFGSIYYFIQIASLLREGGARLNQALANSNRILQELQYLPETNIEKLSATRPNELDVLLVARSDLLAKRRVAKQRRQRRLLARMNKLMSEGGSSR